MNAKKTIILLCMLAAIAPAVYADEMMYDLTITMYSGALNGDTGSGVIAYDPTLAATQGSNSWVDFADGLTEFSITFLGQTFTEDQVVGFPAGPIVTLNPDLSMLSPDGVWGSTTSTFAPDYFLDGEEGEEPGFEYDTLGSNWTASGSGLGLGYSFDPSVDNQFSFGYLTWTLVSQGTGSGVPEPGTAMLLGLGLAVIGWRVYRRKRRPTLVEPQ
jgi:hypothetical protein